MVSIYTRRPDKEFSGDAEFTGGVVDSATSAGMGRAQIGVSGPLSETLGGSVAAAYSGQGLSFKNALPGGPEGNDLARATARGQLLWSPNERFELRFLAGYLQERDAQGESDVYFVPGAPSTTVATLLQQQYSVAPCPDNVPHNRTTCSVATNQLDLNAADLTTNLSYQLANGWTLSSLTGWDRYRDERSDMIWRNSLRRCSTFTTAKRARACRRNCDWLRPTRRASSGSRGSHTMRTSPWGWGRRAPDVWAERLLAFIPLGSTASNAVRAARSTGYSRFRSGHRLFRRFQTGHLAVRRPFILTGNLRWQTEEKRASINNSVTAAGRFSDLDRADASVSPNGATVNGTVSRVTDYLTWSLTPQYRVNDD